MTGQSNRSNIVRGAIVGALAGAVVAVIIVLIIDGVVSGDQNDLLWMPVSIVGGIIGGGVIGMLFSQVIIGGHEDELATQEAHDAAESARNP